jgi:uncharacterized protein involved in exopolysaccharide biosynthesis
MLVTAAGAPVTLEQMTNLAPSDDRLARIAKTYDFDRTLPAFGLSHYTTFLFPFSEKHQSVEESVRQMRKGIRVEATPNGALRLSFTSTQPILTAQITNQMLALMAEEILRNASTSGKPLRFLITNPARIPETPSSPSRAAIVAAGALAGAFLGAILSMIRRRPMPLAS